MTDGQAVTGAIFSLGSEGASRYFRSAVNASKSPVNYTIFVRQYVAAVVPFLNRPEELRTAHESLMLKLPGEMAHLAASAPRGDEISALSQLHPVLRTLFAYPEREDVTPDQMLTVYQTWKGMIASTSHQRIMFSNFAATSLGELRQGRHDTRNTFSVLSTLRQAASSYPEIEADILTQVAVAPKCFVADPDSDALAGLVQDLVQAGSQSARLAMRDSLRHAADKAVKASDYDEACRLGRLMFTCDDTLNSAGKIVLRRNDDAVVGLMRTGLQHLEQYADIAAFKRDEDIFVHMGGVLMSYDEAWDQACAAVGSNGRSLAHGIHDVLMEIQADFDNPYAAADYKPPQEQERPVLRGAWGKPRQMVFLPADPYAPQEIVSLPPKTSALSVDEGADPASRVVSLAEFRQRPKPGAEPTV